MEGALSEPLSAQAEDVVIAIAKPRASPNAALEIRRAVEDERTLRVVT
jgi:hypothetical protein